RCEFPQPAYLSGGLEHAAPPGQKISTRDIGGRRKWHRLRRRHRRTSLGGVRSLPHRRIAHEGGLSRQRSAPLVGGSRGPERMNLFFRKELLNRAGCFAFAGDQRPTTAFMTWIKICGITNFEDALTAVEAGADALGFVFYDKSPRKVDPEAVREIVRALPKGVETVGVFVNERADRIEQCVRDAGLATVQLCGDESVAEFIQYLNARQNVSHRPKIISVVSGAELSEGVVFVAEERKKALHAVLVDSSSTEEPGGTGQRFDWQK